MSPCCSCSTKKKDNKKKEEQKDSKDTTPCCSWFTKKKDNKKEEEQKDSRDSSPCCSCYTNNKDDKKEEEQKDSKDTSPCCSCYTNNKDDKKEEEQKDSRDTSPCCSCFTKKKDNNKGKEQKKSKDKGNFKRSKSKRIDSSKLSEANSSHLDTTAAAFRPRILTSKRIRNNRRVVDSTQCNDPDCPFNKTRERQTMPSNRVTRGQKPRRTQTQRIVGDEYSRPRRARRLQPRNRSPSPPQNLLPPPPRVRPPAPPRTPLPPFIRNKSFIHRDKYITTDDTYIYSESPPQQQYRNERPLPVPQANPSRAIKSQDEEVLELIRRLKPVKKPTSKDNSNSVYVREHDDIYRSSEGSSYDMYKSSEGSSHEELASNATRGYIPPPPPMPPYLLSYRNVLMPDKKSILPKRNAKKTISTKEKEGPLTIIDVDSSQRTNFITRSARFKRFNKKANKSQDSITIFDENTNQISRISSKNPRSNPPAHNPPAAHKNKKKLMLVLDDFK